MKQNKFDTVMDYIDVHIAEETDNIKKGIYNEIGYNSNTFGNCFSVLTNKTLFHYIIVPLGRPILSSRQV